MSNSVFGGGPKESKEILGQSLGESAVVKGLEKDDEGYYLIGSSADLREFANLANRNEPKAKGQLIRDIKLNGGSVIDDGDLKNKDTLEKWTPIGC